MIKVQIVFHASTALPSQDLDMPAVPRVGERVDLFLDHGSEIVTVDEVTWTPRHRRDVKVLVRTHRDQD